MGDCAAFCRSFFVDLDVKADKPGHYKSKVEAIEDLDHFLKVTELPPPVVIDSGNGIHAYWPFEDDVPIAEWKPYADKFKQLCLDHMKIDPVVTADITRIMRCPDTLNFKTDPPNPTRFITEEISQYYFTAFKDYLGEVELPAASILDMVPKGLDEDTKKIAKLDNFETTFQDIAEKSLSEEGCNQIKNALINSAAAAPIVPASDALVSTSPNTCLLRTMGSHLASDRPVTNERDFLAGLNISALSSCPPSK
jgi:hypothetical protein